MELKINEISIPDVIEFNYAELKAEITEKVKTYSSIVYGEDEIKQAKADKANLNKFLKVLSDERIRIKKQCLVPYEEFERKIKEISDIVQEPISIIDNQIKGFDEKKKAEKLELVKALYEELEKPDWLAFAQIFQEKFLNTSCSMANVKQYMLDSIKQINRDIATIQLLPEYSFEALEVYKKCLDVNKAVSRAQEMVSIAKAKAVMTEPKEENQKPNIEIKMEETDEPKEWVSFQAYMTVQQAKDLAWFFKTKGIEFKPV